MYRTGYKIPSPALLAFITLLILGCFGVWYVIGEGYHPNAMRGRLGPSLLWLFALVAFINLAWANIPSKSATERFKKERIAWSVLVAVVALPLLTQYISTGYRVHYFIGDQEYSIPWKYDPGNGKSEPGGTHFVIHVSYPDLIGYYADGDMYRQSGFVVSRAVREARTPDEKYSVNLDACGGEACTLDLAKNTGFFVEGEFLYSISNQGTFSPLRLEDPQKLAGLKAALVNLFNSFKVT